MLSGYHAELLTLPQMGTYLTADIGNTLIKVAVWREGNCVASEFFTHAEPFRISPLIEDFHPRRAMICSVGRDTTAILSDLRARIPQVSRLDRSTPLPIDILYDTPETLGADRVAAAIGARSIVGHGNLLVVDAGTAVTFDRLDAENRYLGGNIAPGLAMRLRALAEHTARLPYSPITDTENVPRWGTDTVTALQAGALEGLVGETLHYRSLMPHDTALVLGGGDAAAIARRIPFKTFTSDSLVNTGLYHIMLYNNETE